MHNVAPTLAELLVPVHELAPYAANARVHDEDALDRSIDELGQYRPIVVNRRDGSILAGNGTYESALRAGWTHVAATYVDVDEQTARKIVLADNRTNDLASYDDSLLARLLEELGDDYSGTGFDSGDLDRLLAELGARGYGDSAQQPHEVEPYTRHSRESMIDAAFEHFRSFTLDELIEQTILPLGECMRQLDRLARTETESLLHSDTAYRVMDRWHRHRYDVPIPGKRSVREVFERDEYLRHAIGQLLDGDSKLSPSTLLSTLAFTRNAQLAANFRPAFALLVYRSHAPVGGRVLDTSTGFGGRLVGFAASRCTEYVGIDPHAVTSAQNRLMAEQLVPSDKLVTLIEQPAEDVTVEQLGGPDSFDVAFTSPPYFGKERYGDGDERSGAELQSWSRYGSGNEWARGFLAPMLQLTYDALRPGCEAHVNIADVKIGSETYPLVEWTQQLGAAVGFEHVRLDRFPLGRVPGRGEAADRYEPIVVLRKPE